MSLRVQITTVAVILAIGFSILGIRTLVEVRNLLAPSVELIDVELVRLGRDEIQLIGVVQVEDPNSRAVSLSELTYQIQVD